MSTLLEQLDKLVSSERPVCYTALVETRGSTPQKPGATMLVQHDGSQVGTLGGGCVEAEVKKRALELLFEAQRNPDSPNRPRNADILTFQLDRDYGWDDGLICGGRMKMAVVPIGPDDDRSYFQRLRDDLAAGHGCTQVVVLDTDSPDKGSAGDLWLLDEEGHVVSQRTAAGKNSLPAEISANLKPLTKRPRPYVTSGVSYLPHLPRCRLIVVGAGHVGQRVAELASDVDFDVWVVDDRQDYCSADRFPTAKQRIVAPFDEALRQLNVDLDTYCIIVTRGHNHDEQALHILAETPAEYLGMIGSRRKIKLIFDDLLKKGISQEALDRVHAPLGLDIGSQTVNEIAISIVAELIAHRNLGS